MDGHPRQDPAYGLLRRPLVRHGRGAHPCRQTSVIRPGEAGVSPTIRRGYAQAMRPTTAEMIAALELEPHPEGGFFRETYRAESSVATARGVRAACTAILFLVTGDVVSRLHRLRSDELWLFHGGLPLEVLLLAPDGQLSGAVLGDPAETTGGETGQGMVPQVLVPARWWQGARPAGGVHLPAERAWSLVSCIVTPGFEFEDFELGEREALLVAYPQHERVILALT